MTTEEYLRYGFALIAVIALIAAAAAILPKLLHGRHVPRVSRKDRRLRVVEMLPLDARRQIVLIRRDQTEHLLLLTHDSGVVIETGIAAEAGPLPSPSVTED